MFKIFHYEEYSLHCEVLQDGTLHVAVMRIGYDETTDVQYSVVVYLDPAPGAAPDLQEFELRFCVTDDADNEVWDGLDTKRSFLSDKGDREIVLRYVLFAVEQIIKQARPKIIVMQTCCANLPDKALSKYEKICCVFRELGYDARQVDPFHGNHMWLAK